LSAPASGDGPGNHAPGSDFKENHTAYQAKVSGQTTTLIIFSTNAAARKFARTPVKIPETRTKTHNEIWNII
jgi:hypothetical protein